MKTLNWLIPLVVIAAIIVSLVALCTSQTEVRTELRSYQRAVKLCGSDNIWKHDYTNGSTDYNCKDYSLIK